MVRPIRWGGWRKAGHLTRHRERLAIAAGRWQRGKQWNNPASHALFFVAFQRRQSDLRPAGVSPVNGVAVVSQRFLREPLRVADGLGTFGPSVAVGMQRHALDRSEEHTSE